MVIVRVARLVLVAGRPACRIVEQRGETHPAMLPDDGASAYSLLPAGEIRRILRESSSRRAGLLGSRAQSVGVGSERAAGSCSGPAAKWLKARRPELEDIALLLARSVKTLEYVGVGVQASAEQTSAEMYTCNCMWFRVAGRPAFTGGGQEGEPMLEPVPAADAEALRERLQAMPRE